MPQHLLCPTSLSRCLEDRWCEGGDSIENLATTFLGRHLNAVEQRSDSQAKQRKASLVKAVEKAKEGRQDTKERSSLLKELKDLREEKTRLLAQLDQYKDCDPEVVEDMRKSNVVAKAAVSRWTDNIFSIKSWTKKKFAFDENRINKAFGIPEDFDYLD
ncbi:hypothetical protein fugu_008019 [Takifugu bimaculatus]|uniref:Leucine zipper with capping helix domain-containing protein n=1 Tax=Takifugu bimaculatus TaxID=433685 RepID=A0A4Z2B2E6_9TELE|nr:hypothetical protein fugu_008019 [Takifugu bimaculatus]